MLALALGFLYGAALVAMPGEHFVGMVPPSICADGNVPRPLFDAFTGLPVGVVVGCADTDGQVGVMQSIPMAEYWVRSMLFGFAGAALALLVLWWSERRRLRAPGAPEWGPDLGLAARDPPLATGPSGVHA